MQILILILTQVQTTVIDICCGLNAGVLGAEQVTGPASAHQGETEVVVGVDIAVVAVVVAAVAVGAGKAPQRIALARSAACQPRQTPSRASSQHRVVAR